MCIAKATSGSWEPPTLKERFDLPTEGFIFRSATSGHGANTRMLLSRQVKFDSRQKRNVAEFIVEPPCYVCVSCSKICPGWGVTEGHLLAMAPFAARHKTRRRKFLMADAEIIFGQNTKRNIVNTNVYKTGSGSQNRDFGELASEQNEFPRQPSRGPEKAGAPNICTSRLGVSTRATQSARRKTGCIRQETWRRMFLPTILSPVLSTAMIQCLQRRSSSRLGGPGLVGGAVAGSCRSARRRSPINHSQCEILRLILPNQSGRCPPANALKPICARPFTPANCVRVSAS